ncbi:MAG: hypothetical protein RL654_2563 [Pseudomonadota bacterium]|jgi:diguanylate cyclase (GGDEF)-like protein
MVEGVETGSGCWHQVVREDIEARAGSADIAVLCHRWRQRRDAQGRVPLAAFADGLWHRLHGRLMLLRREPSPGPAEGQDGADSDFVYGHYGSEICRHTGIDRTGSRLSELGPRRAALLGALQTEALQQGRPIYAVHVAERGQPVFTWERLILPLAPSDGAEWVLVYCRPLQMRHELYADVVDASGDALLALRRVDAPDDAGEGAVGDAGEPGGGWLVLMANPRLAELFEIDRESLAGRLVHRVLPDWRLLHAEHDCLQVMRSGRVRRITRVLMAADGRLRYLQVQIAPMSGGVLLSLSDETDLHEDRNRLRHLAATDALTTLANRRLFDEQLRDLVEQARTGGQPLVLVMADIDAFKAYNDRYGHSAGDDCLRQFALLFKAVFTRQGDLAARYGGEEFAVLLPGTGLEGATALVERLIALLHQRRLPHAASPVAAHVTASFGAAAFDPERDHDELSLLRRADSALYQAKQTGRDRLCVVSTDGMPTR